MIINIMFMIMNLENIYQTNKKEKDAEFFIHLLFFHLIIGAFGLFRITKRSYEDNPESTFTPLPRNITPLGIELDPATGVDITNPDKK